MIDSLIGEGGRVPELLQRFPIIEVRILACPPTIASPRALRSVLLVKTSSLGDVIHNMPAVTDLRAHFPEARIDWVVEEAYAPLVRLHPAIDRIVPVAIRRWRKSLFAAVTWREVKAVRAVLAQRRYDAIIDTQGLVKSAIVARLAPGRRYGLDQASAREPLAARLYDERIPVSRQLHATARSRALVAAALGYTVEGPLDYGLSVAPATGGGDVILLHGTARPEKEWPEAHWAELARSLTRAGEVVTLLRGTAVEAARSDRIAAANVGAGVAKHMDLEALARVIASARAVVGVDTGLLHLAAALKVPTIAIFGATDPALTGPVGAGPITVCQATSEAVPVASVLASLNAMLGNH
ncbi:MAG: lipopolysaccharide heptosyltransferase I [Burkholderiales bacterium]